MGGIHPVEEHHIASPVVESVSNAVEVSAQTNEGALEVISTQGLLSGEETVCRHWEGEG